MESYYELIINITLSEDLRKDKQREKISENSPFYVDFVQNFGFWDFVVAMVIVLKFVTGLFKMQFWLWLVYLTVQLQTVRLQIVLLQ